MEVSDNSNHLPSPPAAVRTKDHRSIELINQYVTCMYISYTYYSTISSGNSEDTDELLRAHLDQWCSEFKSNILVFNVYMYYMCRYLMCTCIHITCTFYFVLYCRLNLLKQS